MKSQTGRKIVWFIAIAASVAGIWISHELTYKHLRVPDQEEDIFDRSCTAFARSSCDEVIKSPWGQFPPKTEKNTPGIPTAELGAFFFAGMLAWTVLIGPVSRERWEVHLIFVIATGVGLAICAFLAAMMYGTLEYWCPLCAVTHGLSLVLFICALLLWPRESAATAFGAEAGVAKASAGEEQAAATGGETPGEAASKATAAEASGKPAGAADASDDSLFGKDEELQAHVAAANAWPSWWMVAVTGVVAVLGVGLQYQHFQAKATEVKLEVAKYYHEHYEKLYKRYNRHWQHTYYAWGLTPPVKIETEGLPFRGPENARHTVVIFSDFQCPACKRFADWFEKTIMPIGAKTGGLKVYFKHWPISPSCNPTAKNDLHPLACQAAYAAEAARVVGGGDAFWEMHDALYAQQPAWVEDQDFARIAEDLGLDRQAFLDAMESPAVHARIKAHIEEAIHFDDQLEGEKKEMHGEFVNVNSTPSVFVDNKRLHTWGHVRTWAAILQRDAIAGPSADRDEEGDEDVLMP